MPYEYYSCKACDKNFNGRRPYEDHIVSANHQKKINPQHMANTVVDSSIKKPLENYSCRTCDKVFNGKRPYEDHIVSANHKKKINLQVMAHTGVDFPMTMPLEKYSCKACDKVFSGKRPYEDHIVSVNHQKKIKPQPVAQTVVDSSIRLSQQCLDPFIVPCGSIYHCKICDTPLNGPDQIGAHIVGKKHLKMEQKQPLNISENIAIEETDIEKVLKDVKVFKVNDPIVF